MTVKNTENKGNFNTEEADYSDLYPSRKKSQNKISTWFDKITFNKERERYQKLQCEINVFECMKSSKFCLFEKNCYDPFYFKHIIQLLEQSIIPNISAA